MPELPEVETMVTELNEANLVGQCISKAQVLWPRSLWPAEPEVFCKRICGQIIKSINRRGKFIVFYLSEDNLFVHLRMTGKFFITDINDVIHSHERIRLNLEDGRYLIFEDQRKFGKWYLRSDADAFVKNLGVEPLSEQFNHSLFHKLLQLHCQKIKPFLLNQQYIVGLGNIYVDEALWEANVHPLRITNSLTKKESKILCESIKKVLAKGIKNAGTSLGNNRGNYYSISGKKGGNQYQLNVFRQEGRTCPRCGGVIIKIVVSQRGTHLCPSCQK